MFFEGAVDDVDFGVRAVLDVLVDDGNERVEVAFALLAAVGSVYRYPDAVFQRVNQELERLDG